MSQEYAKSYDQLLDGAEVRHTSFYQQRPPPIVCLLSQTIVLVPVPDTETKETG